MYSFWVYSSEATRLQTNSIWNKQLLSGSVLKTSISKGFIIENYITFVYPKPNISACGFTKSTASETIKCIFSSPNMGGVTAMIWIIMWHAQAEQDTCWSWYLNLIANSERSFTHYGTKIINVILTTALVSTSQQNWAQSTTWIFWQNKLLLSVQVQDDNDHIMGTLYYLLICFSPPAYYLLWRHMKAKLFPCLHSADYHTV